METISFGRTGLKVSKLCFGTMTIGASSWKPWVLDEADAEPVLKRCLDLGITFFDTANWYSSGESERVVASTLTSMVPRDRLVLATKALYAMSDDPNDRGLSRKHLLSSVDSSLRRMGTDYIDIFMIHSFDPDTPIEETMEALHDIVKSGKVAVRRNGEEFGTFGPNDEFGEMAALSTKPRIADAVALEDTVCYTLEGDDFRELLRAEPELAIELAATFAKRLARS